MPTVRETTFNTTLAEILRRKNPRWRKDNALLAEAGGALRDGGTPDILIAPSGAMPIVVETEFFPARTVEQDALARLGCATAESKKKIEQAIALRAPKDIKTAAANKLEAEICTSKLEYCLFSFKADVVAPVRWPSDGWLRGGVDELVALIENAGVSEQLIAKSLETLQGEVAGAAATFIKHTHNKPAVREKIAKHLHQSNTTQTMQMAMAIIANAITFQEILSGVYDIRSTRDLRISNGKVLVGKTQTEWRRIRAEINYYPIFNIADQIANEMPTDIALDTFTRLADTVEELIGMGIIASHDLHGRMFQRLITDRRFLATFYTLPESAMLLAEIAVDMMGVDFSDQRAAPQLRIADFACGTGTLLSAAYHAVLARHRRAGHDDAKIHKEMMENALVATDIMPAGVHLTASILSSVHPDIAFEDTKVHTLPYGIEEGLQVSLGALDLLEKQASRDLLQIRRRLGGYDEEEITSRETDLPEMFELEHDSFDLVIMNPPFTRPTNHEITDRPVPSFAGFNTSEDEQKAMSSRLQEINRGLPDHAGHGNAGLASNFIDLAHQKLKAGGVLSMVLPSTFVQGKAWERSRQFINKFYDDILIISLASAGAKTRSFSADTGMAEILLVARKREAARADGCAPVRFVSLRERPANAAQAAVVARAILDSTNGVRTSEHLGESTHGTLLDGGAVGILDGEVPAIAKALRSGILQLPRVNKKYSLPITTLGEIAERQLVDRDINGVNSDRSARGPFDIEPIREGVPTYPCLWSRCSDLERRLIVKPDTQGRARKGMSTKANEVWETATTLHFNRDFQLNANSLAACVTLKPTLGGRAWPSARPLNPKHEPAIVLWANTTLGLLLWWWIGGRQQNGRARITISQLPNLPFLDTRRLSAQQHRLAADIFKQFKSKDFRAANEAYRCESRCALDRAVLIELLGLPESILGPLDTLRDKWCSEPSVHGGKRTRPQSA